MKKFTIVLLLSLCFLISDSLIAQNFSNTIGEQLNGLVDKNKLLKQDTQWRITSESVSRTSGIQHVYFRQSLNGLDVYGTESSVHISTEGKIISHNNHFEKNTAQKLVGATTPTLSASQQYKQLQID